MKTKVSLIKICSLGMIIISCLFPLSLKAQEARSGTNAMLILDGSGSMWGKLKEGHKVLIARKAIANSVRGFEDKLNLGLMAYGHRRRAACNDIQLINKPGPLNPLTYSRLVNKIKPLGKTPITSSLQQASKNLKQQNTKGGHIILLTDGPENCRKLPCTVISPQFAKANNITVHVIAFAMQAKDAQSLKCLASNSGGQFFTPINQSQLTKAITASLSAALKDTKGAIGQIAKPQTKRTKANLKLTAHLGPSSKALATNVQWKIEKLTNENKPEQDLPAWKSKKPIPNFELNPGQYRITTQYQDFEISKDINLKKGQDAGQKIIFNLSELTLPASWAKPNSRSGFGKLLLEPQDEDTANQEPLIIALNQQQQTQLIPAGAYKLSGIENGQLQTWFIHAQAGKPTPLPIWQTTGRLKLNLTDATTGKPLSNPLVQVFELKSDQKTNIERARSSAHAPLFDLKTGQYSLKISQGYAHKTMNVNIEPKKQTTLDVKLNLAQIKITLNKNTPSEQYSLAISRKNKAGRFPLIDTLSTLDQPITVSPGTYRLSLRAKDTQTALSKTVKLASGKVQEISFATKTSQVTFQISNRTDLLSKHQIFWRLFEKSGNLIWQGSQTEAQLGLPKGDYKITAEIGDDKYAKTFRVKGNHKKTIDLAKNKQK